MKVEGRNHTIELDKSLVEITPRIDGWPRILEAREIRFVEYHASDLGSDGSLTFHLKDGNKETIRFVPAKSSEFRLLATAVDSLVRNGGKPILPVTTGVTIPGRDILEIVDVISSEAAMGMNIFKDIANMWRDAVGGRSKSLQGVLREAREACINELRREAQLRFADAVIGVDLDYTEFSSTMVSGGMVMVVASGTAVRLVPLQ